MKPLGQSVCTWICGVTFGLTLAALGCSRVEDTEDSALKWGMLSHVSSTGLLTLEPQSKICFRGYHAQEALNAVRQWTDAIGRTAHLTTQVGCDDGQRNIDIFGPQDAACTGGEAGSTDTISRINVCQEYPENYLTHILLHETGHMWGLCDQYGGGTDCHGGTTVDPNSIMGAARGLTQLTPDDIEGIRYITSQPQLGANQAWQNLPAPKAAPNPAQPGSSPPGPGGSPQSQAQAKAPPTAPAPATASGNPTILQQIICQLTSIGCVSSNSNSGASGPSSASTAGG